MDERNMQHGVDWIGDKIDGYIATEKYNGCRAYWDGKNLWSRGGIKINIPTAWRRALPAGIHLDGEIYDGVDGLYRCGGFIRSSRATPSMRFMVFDCPAAKGNYLDRLKAAKKYEGGPLKVVPGKTIAGLNEAKILLAKIIKRRGEGLVMRKPDIKYRAGRTAEILKLKAILAGQ